MVQMTNLYFTLLFVYLCRGQRSNPDGERSSCDHCDQWLTCNCSHGGFTRVPIVTGRALTLDLSFNDITVVTSEDLTGHRRLRVLSLHGNGVATIHPSAFDSLWSLEELDLSDNQLTALNDKWLVRLRRLALGGPALEKLKRGDLSGVTELDELTVHGNNLTSYESGALGDVWPLGRVTLSLHGPFLKNTTLASAVLADVTYPETPLVLEDLHLIGNESVQPFRESARRRVRKMAFNNILVSDEAIVNFLVVMDGVPLTSLFMDGVTLTGEGRWEGAKQTDLKSIDEFFVRNVVVYVMPCNTSHLLSSLQYLDLSDNLLTDLTLAETMCNGDGTMKDLRVLNVSGNALKSLLTVSRQVTKLSKLTHLDISRTGYSSMPEACSWPSTLRYLNISGAKLTTITPSFLLIMPVLRELHLSGNKLLKLPPGWLFPNLQTLTIQANTLNRFNRADLQSYRRLQDLRAGQNKFACSCDFVYFLKSGIKGGEDVHLADGEESYVCDSPLYLQGEPVGQVQLSIVVCQRVLFVSVSCGVALFVGILLCVLLWRLHAFWYVKMTWAWLRAKRSSMRRRRRRRDRTGSEELPSYDAFVSYSERDASWVENFLVPELEEPRENDEDSVDQGTLRPLTLCLHKRDFLPGHWIVDNIMSAMERSRRTVFVLSENFVQSDWCRYELDFSHFQLFDGNAGGDEAILILLEPLSKDDIPKRFCKLRKLMSSTTYLEWPRDEERIGEFWRSLRHALRGEDQNDD
ncbi:hypothetical protein FQN60_017406 [Etheostoma spectabile]|uniref:Toll-like receptor 2 n=1 Tax=Etheostoma spectabile TaxID=54343 RepID=A0A5J5DFC0_9PERO|nr:hypothetical protein FQN60_017406 [Etheostoma spectabile]